MKGKGKDKVAKERAEIKPLLVAEASDTKIRRNSSSVGERTDRFKNINDGLVPFKYSSGATNNSNIDVKDAVTLCQKAYYNFAIFRNVIDLMTEFSTSDIYFKGGSKKSRDFFSALFNKINIWSLQDRFFREYYRSGNVFIYRFDTEINQADALKITQTFGAQMGLKVVLPSRYIILNPADIQLSGAASFVNGNYLKLVSDYELTRLRTPKTDEDLEILNSLDEKTKNSIQKGKNSSVYIPLDQEKINAIFYKKQDYEPFAVPMGYPVLEDINWKQEMKKMDMAIARTMQQAILLVTMGTKPEEGGVNQKNLEAMRSLFENQSVGRVLIADYTTEAKFVIPDISNLLDSRKYEVVERDIQLGLNNVLTGGEKFSNQQMKVEVFLGRLTQAREAFINEFLIQEIKRISKALGFKNYPTPYFDKISLSDNTNMLRIYNRLIELGVLTAEEGLKAIETGRLPEKEESIQSQREFLSYKDEGLYDPLIGGKNQSESAGRPVEKAAVVTANNEGGNFSLRKVTDNFLLAEKLQREVEVQLKKIHKLKKLSEEQRKISEQISSLIISNEPPENWMSQVENYIKNPIDKNTKRIEEIRNLAVAHQVNEYLAGILYASRA
jgi:hypothetical protein